jgi:ComF family protein
MSSLLGRIAGTARTLGRSLDILVPPLCASCGIPGGGLCEECRGTLLIPPAPLCACCGHPAAIEVSRCPQCPPGVIWARQAVLYEGPAPLLVSALKDRRRRALAALMAEIMAERVAPPRGSVLAPVPLSPRREAERGFNQSRLLALQLAKLWDTRVADLLERARESGPQRGASATDRTRQVAAAFRARPAPIPRAVCIVDDVHTTGSTLAACARALRRGGAREVSAVCFARAASR